MKVLFINKFFYQKGGAETVFFQERDCLKRQGHTVVDFSMADSRNMESTYAEFFVPNVDYSSVAGVWRRLSVGLSFIHSRVAVRNLTRLVRREMPDLAHLHNIYHQLTPSIIPVLKKYGVKVVLTLHDCKLICPGYLALNLKNDKICVECAGRKFWRAFTLDCQASRGRGLLLAAEAMFHKWRNSYGGVDLFLAPSRFMANLMEQRFPSDKIVVLHNGIDPNECRPSWRDDGYALYLGRLSREKGVETLLRAHRSLDPSIPLKIAGTGPLEEALRSRYPDVDFLGHRSGKELNDLIANATFVVVPSECYENCSMVVLESMAFGKPVIGTRIGGIPEQIEDGKTGLLFQRGDVNELKEQMVLLWRDPELRREMGRAARRKLELEYSLDRHCRQLVAIYLKLLQKRKMR